MFIIQSINHDFQLINIVYPTLCLTAHFSFSISIKLMFNVNLVLFPFDCLVSAPKG